MGIFKLGRYAALATLLLVLAAGIGAALAFNYSFANHPAGSLATLRTVGEQRLQPRVVAASLHMMKSDLAGRRYLGRGMNDLRTEAQSFEAALAQLDAAVTGAARSASALNTTP